MRGLKSKFVLVNLFYKFFSHPARDRWFLIEALAWLWCAKLLLLIFPFRWIAPRLGKRVESPANIAESERHIAMRISWAVQAVARNVPLNLVCLPQAIAAKWMLRRRSIPSTLYFGICRGQTEELNAHAWLRSGDRILTGGAGSREHQVIAKFSDDTNS